MEIGSQITVSVNPALHQAGLKLDMFKPGSILRLQVLELRGNRALVDFGTFKATADVKVPVTLGEKLLVRVQETGRQLKLNLLNTEQIKNLTADSAPRSAGQFPAEDFKRILTDLKPVLNQILASPDSAKLPSRILDILGALNARFEGLDVTTNIAEIVSRIKAYLENSGLFYEKLLEKAILKPSDNAETETAKQPAGLTALETLAARDFKAGLLMLKDFGEHDASFLKILDDKAVSTLRRTAEALLADIEQQQGRAVKRMDGTEPFQVFNYTLPLKDDNRTARLKVYYQKLPRAGKRKGFRISLLLSMDRLGDLRTDFNLLEKDLTLTFFVKDQPAKAVFQQHVRELQELLAPLFDQLFMRVLVSEKKIKDFDRQYLQAPGDKRVDLRI
jgi:hypothetical protein